MILKDNDYINVLCINALHHYVQHKNETAFADLFAYIKSTSRDVNLANHEWSQADITIELDDQRISLDAFATRYAEIPISLNHQFSHLNEQSQTEARREFLHSDFHAHLPFTPDTIIFGITDNQELINCTPVRLGRLFQASPELVVDFLRRHPEGRVVLSELAMIAITIPQLVEKLGYSFRLESFDDLEHFLREDQDFRTDMVIDNLKEYLFDESLYGEDIARKKAAMLAPNPNAAVSLHVQIQNLTEHNQSLFHALDPITARTKFIEALEAIQVYADEIKAENFEAIFQRSLDAVRTNTTALEPAWSFTALPDEEASLFWAAYSADVFAGMGSWNDLPTAEDARFHEVSNQLILALLNAVCVSASPGQ